MTVAFVVGAGDGTGAGLHAARQLAVTEGIHRLILAARNPTPSASDADAGASGIEALDWAVGDPFPDDVEVVVVAIAGSKAADLVAAAVEAGIHVVTGAGSPEELRRLLELAPSAAASGSRVVVGAGLAPGLSEILAMYGAESLDRVTEIHVARYGAPSRADRSAVRRSAWGVAEEIDEGVVRTARTGGGRRLVGFPSPVGLHDCRYAATAIPRLVPRVVPGVERVTVRQALSRTGRLTGRAPTRRGSVGPTFGAIHVEVRGRRGASTEILTFGAVDHLVAATGGVLAAAAAAVCGLAPGMEPPPPGVMGLAEVAPARALLAELKRRGVRAARFEKV